MQKEKESKEMEKENVIKNQENEIEMKNRKLLTIQIKKWKMRQKNDKNELL